MRCLILSAYHAPSHAYWARGLMAALPQWQWQLLSLPPRYFNWRIRGNALAVSAQLQAHLPAGGAVPWDLIVATSMTDICGLKALRPELAQTPVLLYFHENQFDYPANEVQRQRLEPAMMTLFSALAAQQLAFNSAYNRDSFLTGVHQLLAKLPDGVPPDTLESLRRKACVLPVPLDDGAFVERPQKASTPTFIWNHRWEHDKAPERLLAAIRLLLRETDNFRLHLVGQQFRQQPAVFAELESLLRGSGALGAWGYQASRTDYQALLNESHGVISTAQHDFQGLAVLEAVAAGACPLVPRRLAYPEWFGDQCYPPGDSPEAEARALAGAMLALINGGVEAVPDLRYLGWSAQAGAYEQLLQSVAGRRMQV